MALSKKEYLESLLQLLTVIKDKHVFTEPLDQQTRVRLAAFSNSAIEMGLPDVNKYLSSVLKTNDPTAQEILLFSGITKGAISKQNIKPVFDILSNSLTLTGGDPDKIVADTMTSLAPPEETDMGDLGGMEDGLGDMGDMGAEEDLGADAEGEGEGDAGGGDNSDIESDIDMEDLGLGDGGDTGGEKEDTGDGGKDGGGDEIDLNDLDLSADNGEKKDRKEKKGKKDGGGKRGGDKDKGDDRVAREGDDDEEGDGMDRFSVEPQPLHDSHDWVIYDWDLNGKR